MMFGGIGVAVVVILIVVMSRGGTKKEPADTPPPPAAATPAPPRAPASTESARAGKPPAKPAPALSPETLQQARDLLAQAKTLCNEGVQARTAGNNQEARDKQSAAKAKVDALKKLVGTQALWQEEAQMSDWAQPAEYVALEKLYGEVSKLEKQIRMGGGT